MTDKESEQFIVNARIKDNQHMELSEAEKLILALIDGGRYVSHEEVEWFIYFMDIKYTEFKQRNKDTEERKRA